MIVFVMFLMYQEQQMADVALEAQSLVEGQAGGEGESESIEAAGIGGDERSGETSAARTPTAAPAPPEAAVGSPAAPPSPARNIPIQHTILENGNVIAKISNGPALVESWRLKHYAERLPDGEVPIELVTEGQPFLITDVDGVAGASFAEARLEVVSTSEREVVQRARNAAGVLTRTIRLDESGYGFALEFGFQSLRTDPIEARIVVLWPAAVSSGRRDFAELSLLAKSDEEGVVRELVAGVGQANFLSRFFGGGSSDGLQEIEGRAKWAGFDIQYFTGVLIDPEDRARLDVEFEMLEPSMSAQTRVRLEPVAIGSGGTLSASLRGFAGPKLPEALANSGAALEQTINRGWSWLEPLTRFFEIALDKLYLVIPNYGLAIIVLTILVRLAVSPLMVRQMRSAERMRSVQPRVKALQEKYKDDRQKQSEEMMKLWKEEGINPLGGCLPLVFQFPVLIGLFYALRSSIGLRHAPFMLWIDDLSQPATLFMLPGLDFPVRLLPIIMGASMVVQQKMTPTTGMDPAQEKMMLVMMPAMMLLISYTFPSGLVLYWTVSNLLGIGHQYWIRSKMQPAS